MIFKNLLTEALQYPTGTEKACAEFLFQMKWPEGFSCPRCEHTHFYLTTTRRLPLYECQLCRHQTSLLAGTIFEGSKTELSKWITALYLVSSNGGTSAMHLSQIIQVTYKTAWLMLHKIRFAISSADMDTLLFGTVKVNAAVYGRPPFSSCQSHPSEHPFFVGAGTTDEPSQQNRYVKMKLVSKKHLRLNHVMHVATQAFTKNEVSPQTTDIRFVTQRYSSQRFIPLLQLAGELGQWVNRTFLGLGRKHLQAYLDEFCYRVNHCDSFTSLPLTYQLAHICLKTNRITYPQLVKGVW